MYRVKKTTHAHLEELSETMCEKDKDELARFGWSSPYAALLASFCNSQRTATVTYNGAVVCIFGCVRVGGFGVIWLLSIGMSKHRLRLMKWIRPLLRWASKGCLEMGNWVPDFQVVHVRWLKHLGFEVTAERDTPDGMHLLHMTRRV